MEDRVSYIGGGKDYPRTLRGESDENLRYNLDLHHKQIADYPEISGWSLEAIVMLEEEIDRRPPPIRPVPIEDFIWRFRDGS